jgi:hypothetical protein
VEEARSHTPRRSTRGPSHRWIVIDIMYARFCMIMVSRESAQGQIRSEDENGQTSRLMFFAFSSRNLFCSPYARMVARPVRDSPK